MNQKERLLTALKGGVPDKVPNFEVWWGANEGIEKYFLGHPVKTEEDAVKFAKKIGWGSVNGGFFGMAAGVSSEASDGSSHYAGGSWKTWKDYENLKFPLDSLEEKLIHLKKILNERVEIGFVVLDNDCAYKNGLMVSPELFEKLWFKRTEKTMQILKDGENRLV